MKDQCKGKDRFDPWHVEQINTPAEADNWGGDFYRMLFQEANDPMFVLGMTDGGVPGRYLEVNEAACMKFGYSRDEFLQLSPEDIETPGSAVSLRGRMERLLEEKNILFESQLTNKDGVSIAFETSARLFYHHDKAMIVLIKRDISRRRQAEEAFKSLVVNAPIGIYVVQNGRFKLTNPGFQSITGYSHSELLERKALTIVAPDFREIVRENAVRMLNGERTAPYEFCIQTKNGDTRWIFEVVRPTRHDDDRATLGYFMDITEQKSMEEVLRLTEERYRDLFIEAPIGIIQCSLEGKPLHVNPAFAHTLGYNSPEDFVSSVTDIGLQVYADTRQRSVLIEALLKDQAGLCGFECLYRRKDGSIITVNLHGRIVRDSRGAVQYVEAFVEDITHRKLLEEALTRGKQELEIQVAERTQELNAEAQRLAETNTALRVILNARESDRRELEEAILCNAKTLIGPCVERLKKSRMNADQKLHLKTLEAHIESIISPFIKNLSQNFSNLTRTEIRIVGLLKEGKTTKEIAELLCLSDDAIVFHRRNIRGKLGLKGKKINLVTYLQSFDH